MATGIIYDYVDGLSSNTYTVEGDAMYGDNGPMNGSDPELTLYTSSDYTDGRTVWDPYTEPDGSWDSGDIAVTFSLTNDGLGHDVISWGVNGQTPITLTEPSIGVISNVTIAAGVQTNAEANWSNLSITFSGGSSSDTYSGSNPSVDLSTSTSTVGEEDLIVSTAHTDETNVSVTGYIHFSNPANVYPNPADMFGSIKVNSL